MSSSVKTGKSGTVSAASIFRILKEDLLSLTSLFHGFNRILDLSSILLATEESVGEFLADGGL